MKRDDMEYNYTVTLDITRQAKKPNKNEIPTISNRLTLQTGLTVNELFTYLTQPYSYTWCPSLFNGKRKNDNWEGQMVFALDFDCGVKPDEVIKQFNDFGIRPNIIYYSFSDSTELRKFRIILLVDTVVTDYEQALAVRKGLINTFPQCDKSCKDAARMFFGGKNGELLNAEPIRLEKIVEFICINLISGDDNQTRKIEENWYNLLLYNNDIQKSAKNDEKSKKSTSTVIPQTQLHTNKYLESLKNHNFNFEKMKDRVQIFREFSEGKRLSHDELLGLATNLIWTKGGLSKMKSTMLKYNHLGITDYSQHNFNILPYVKKMGYYPMWLKKFSPYPDDWNYTNLISAGKDTRGMIEVLEPQTKITLEQGEQEFERVFNEIINKENNKIYLIKATVGLGKTGKITNLNQYTLAFPTHDLITEVSNRMTVDYVTTPPIPTFFDKQHNDKIGYLYKSGLNKEVYSIIRSIATDTSRDYNNAKDRTLAMQYLENNTKATKSSETVLTTHIRAMMNEYQHDTIIFDEDPLDSLIEIKRLDTKDLHIINNGQFSQEATREALTYINSIKPGEMTETPRYAVDYEQLLPAILWSDVSSNVIRFFDSTYFTKDERYDHVVHYITKRELPSDKKIIILSATAPIPIYKKLFGDRLEVIDIGNVINQGNVEQHTNRSFSRSSLTKVDLDEIKELVGNKPVITFQSFSDKINSDNLEIHYGNCEGFDSLKGQDIVVLGTPHLNNIFYFLYAKVLGIKLDDEGYLMRHQKIEWNGFRFMFMSFNDEQLRTIQLSLIESELQQAVGRARTIRTDAKVMVYSNLPLTITDKFVY